MRSNSNESSMEEFFEGVGLSPEVVEAYEERRGFKSVVKALAGLVACSMLAGALLSIPPLMVMSGAVQVGEPLADVWKGLPSQLDEESIVIGERSVILDKNGDEFAEFWSEDRIQLDSLDDISDYAELALINTEDKRFYEHGGIDIAGTARAALRGGGGSGITQQLVKNLQFYNLAGTAESKSESVEHSYSRKLRELKLAVGYEENHTKDEILLQYFNTVAVGGPNTYSIESAANYFFGKSAKDLDLAESAALVGTVQNPAGYNMGSSDEAVKDRWKARQKVVLGRMVAEGSITQDEADKAYEQELKIVKKTSGSGNCSSSEYQYYCDLVMKELRSSPKLAETREERDAIIAKGGLTIKTYLDPTASDAMNDYLSGSFGDKNRIVGATALVQPGTGGIIGTGGNRQYGEGDGKTTLNLADRPAGTGSTYKMVTLAAALESGMSESDLKFGSQCPFQPGPNYDAPPGGFGNSNGCSFQAGVLDYQKATAWSSNTWFLTLATKTGMDNVISMSKDLGLSVPDSISERSLALVIGSTENSPIDMAAAYATFVNGGIYCPPKSIASYEYSDGTSPAVPDTYKPEEDSCRRVMSPHTASVVLKAMRANTYPGYVKGAFGTKAQIDGYDAVGKSGTNQNLNYTWAQVSKDYSMFIDIYDMDSPANGLGSFYFNGGTVSSNVAPLAGSGVLKSVRNATGAKGGKLDYNSNDRTLDPVEIEKREYFTVPSMLGLSPEEARAYGDSLDIPVKISKTKKPAPENYSSGVVVEQSLKAGMELPKGTEKELVLYVSE